ncbi:MAG TPA: class I SAM-dependent methyltransferase, partial [Terriglobales bacterium]|nr:class I SAM-dependent methyltransferase [Terriglobales bacterium]
MVLQNASPTERFADRVDDYVKYRPHYSPNVIKALQEHCDLSPRHLVADVGCGTGLLAKIFLENGNRVIGVEPNENMRKAGEAYLLGHERFRMADGTAEKTGLLPESADFVVAGQAFHWFQPAATRREFARIVKSNGWVV